MSDSDDPTMIAGDGMVGSWSVVEMDENFYMDGSIFQAQIMQGGQADASAMNVSVYTQYDYQFMQSGDGYVSTEDTDGNMMENTPLTWSFDEDAMTLTVVTDVFVRDERVYDVISMDQSKIKLSLDHTYPENDEFDRGGQQLKGSYVLKRN